MEFQVIDINQVVDVNELLEVINANAKVANFYRGEITKMQAAAKHTIHTTSQIESEKEEYEDVEELTETSDEKSDFEEEVEYYLTQLRELAPDNIEEKISEVLPVRKNKNYKKIILRLKLESLKNIKELEEMISECLLLGEQDEIESFKQEILSEKKIISLLDNALLPQTEIKQQADEQEENNLIFVPTTGGNIRVLDEIDHIPEEYYEGFYELFRSIKEGTFKNVKRFKNHSTIAGISEVKDFKIRVVFTRLDKNSYAIISVFMKKHQNDKAYNEALKSKIGDYRSIADTLKKNLQDEEFVALQRQYEEELFRKLGKEIAPPKTLEKGGI